MWKKDFLLHGIYLKNSADSYLNFSTSFTSLIRAYSRKLGHACNFSEKGQNRVKYLKISAKMYKFEKIFKKGSLMRATIVCVKQLEYALLIV